MYLERLVPPHQNVLGQMIVHWGYRKIVLGPLKAGPARLLAISLVQYWLLATISMNRITTGKMRVQKTL